MAVHRIGVWLGIVIILASVVLGRAQTSKSEEYLLLGNANRGAGEPMVAVDPTNLNNIIAVAMGSVQQLHGKPSTQGSYEAITTRVANSTITWLAVTHDGGVTWDVKELPILSGKLTRCPDSFADVTKDGVFIAGCEPRETASDPDYWGMSALVVSTDKGQILGSGRANSQRLRAEAIRARAAAGSRAAFLPARQVGSRATRRGIVLTHRIDDSTGVIYGVAQGGSAIVDAAAGRRTIAGVSPASTDQGKSFGHHFTRGTLHSIHRPAAESHSRRHTEPSRSPTSPAARSPRRSRDVSLRRLSGCSRDRGRTFTYHVLKKHHGVAG